MPQQGIRLQIFLGEAVAPATVLDYGLPITPVLACSGPATNTTESASMNIGFIGLENQAYYLATAE